MADEISVRHREEARFFDELAIRTRETMTALDRVILDRYRRADSATARFPLEYAVARARCSGEPLVLDVGCGDGANAVLLALLGAKVTGFDISPEAVALANERARINGVSDRTSFHVATAETFVAADSSFDVVWCDAVLHHVIPQLTDVLARLRRFQRECGRTIFIEPVSRSRALRTLRRLVPVRTEATPGERPLRIGELNQIRAAFPQSRARYFRTFGRLDRILLRNGVLETAPAWRKASVQAIAALDHVLNRTPVSRFASVMVMVSET